MRRPNHGAADTRLGIIPIMSAPATPDGPLIVQSDKSVLLEVARPGAEDARRDIAPFAELERAQT